MAYAIFYVRIFSDANIRTISRSEIKTIYRESAYGRLSTPIRHFYTLTPLKLRRAAAMDKVSCENLQIRKRLIIFANLNVAIMTQEMRNGMETKPFVNVKLDYGFKWFFGQLKRKHVLIRYLNAIFKRAGHDIVVNDVESITIRRYSRQRPRGRESCMISIVRRRKAIISSWRCRMSTNLSLRTVSYSTR